ncbi:MAG: endonuclease III [Oscillospiraceae bacterium]|nr:endonuclease III [Oscillospiraceae bacterium]
MTKKERAAAIIAALEEEYPLAECTLDYDEAWKLLVSVRLAAQCTDARVNVVVKELYAKYPSLEALAAADVSDIEEIVRPCGLGPSKARDISACMKMLISDYGGRVPDEIDELLKLPGVGRKSANLVVGDVYGKPAIVCDTHCIRLTRRFGLTDTDKPDKCEKQLRAVVAPDKGSDFCHRLVLHGRAVCTARSPKCGICLLNGLCLKKGVD